MYWQATLTMLLGESLNNKLKVVQLTSEKNTLVQETSGITLGDLEWEIGFARLVAFKQAQGHTNVPAQWPADPELARWIRQQRHAHEFGLLYTRQSARLSELGFNWQRVLSKKEPTLAETIWEGYFLKLASFQRKHGHMRIPKANPEDRQLREWVLEQLTCQRQGCLSPARREQLDSIGFEWYPLKNGPPRVIDEHQRPSSIWGRRFAELVDFQQKYGHMRIPKTSAEHARLRGWVVSQRVYKRKGSLRYARQKRLESIGFDWNPATRGLTPTVDRGQGTALVWEQRFDQLRAFQERHGHTRVLSHRGEDRELGGWVVRQRSMYRRGKLRKDYIQRLDEMGFDWKPIGRQEQNSNTERPASDKFNARIAEFRAFHLENGHCDVPTKYPANPKLGNWVSNMRSLRKKGLLSPGRIMELDALGFNWVSSTSEARRRAQWERLFAELLGYKRLTGHVNVPLRYKLNPKLAKWVVSLRLQHRGGSLSENCVQRLNAIGFQWLQR